MTASTKVKSIDVVLSALREENTKLEGRIAQLEAHEGGSSNLPIALLEDQKTSGTNGGTFTNGADRTRDLNTEVSDADGIVSIAANQFTLGAGTYLIEWEAPARNVSTHQSFLYNITGASEVKRGSTARSAADATTTSTGGVIVTLVGSVTYEIRHRCNLTQATTGFGTAGGFGTEVYTRVVITKLA